MTASLRRTKDMAPQRRGGKTVRPLLRPTFAGLILSGGLALSGCTVGPDYTPPAVEIPGHFKEGPAQEPKNWRSAQPRDDFDRGAWWALFREAELNKLLPQVEVNNQNVAASLAAYEQSQAMIREAQASLLPGVSANYEANRTGASSRSSTGSGTAYAKTYFYPNGQVSWTLDIWGKVRRQVESDVAAAQADKATLANATLSYQAQLATAYFNLRYEDSLRDLLERTVKIYQETETITLNQYNSGTVSKADLITAQTQVLNTQASAIATQAPRAQYEHAIAVLIGKPPAEVRIPRGNLGKIPPAPPAGLPSTLLERRPDVAAAERNVAAQNAAVGVAVAAFYPTLTLSANGGFAGPNAFPFLAAYQVWSLGATAADPLLDGGLRAAEVDAAKAAWRQSVANYRQTTLAAFQSVEDQLSNLRTYARQLSVQEKARDEAAEAVRVYLNQYKAGTVAFTTVVVAEATLLADEEAVLVTRQALFTSTVALIEALGGGFDAKSLEAEQAPPLIEAVARSGPIPPPTP